MLALALAALGLSAIFVALGEVWRMAPMFLWLALGVYVLADLFLSPRPKRALAFEPPAEVYVGEEFPLTLEVSNAPVNLRGRWDWPDGIAGPDDFFFVPAEDGVGRAQLGVTALRRGSWSLDQLWLSWISAFGLIQSVRRLPMDHAVRVVPNIRSVQSGEISTKVASNLYGVKENLAVGEGSEFHQLREFVPGMDVKTIDWKRSARARNLIAKELRAERNHHVILALDNGYLMAEEIDGIPKIDHAVTAALATAWAAAIGGDLVGYYSYEVRPRGFFVPEPGRAAFARMRSWTADLDYVTRETNHTLALTELNARCKKRSLIIIFTDFIDTTSAELLIENIGLIAKRHLVVFVAIRDTSVEKLVEHAPEDMDGVAMLVAANQSIAERRLVLERLSRLGVTIIDAKPKAITAKLISTYLEIKARELI
ncbi:MAG: DUF58 domain-containing protein [Pseudomonadota bacterium]